MVSINLGRISEALNKPIDADTSMEQALDDKRYFDGVYLFFSFDLVNSTEFKSQHNDKWLKLFTRFYEFVLGNLKNYYDGISLWKYIGDEVLLYLKVKDFEQIYDAPINVIKVIEEVTNQLYTEVNQAQNQIFIKSTLWIANINFLESHDMTEDSFAKYKNVAFISSDTPEWLEQNIDFLGPDIDLGFRLSKYTHKAKLLISAELAYILHRKNGEISRHSRANEYKYKPNDCCKIITLEKLKGIWDNRRYPIIWFSTSWGTEEIFDYDEHLDSHLVKIIKDEEDLKLEDQIDKIFNDLEKTSEVEEVIELISNTPQLTSQPRVQYNISNERLAEVHCAAICFNDDGKMLIAKRLSNKKRLEGRWEFGCGQLEVNQTIEMCLSINYKKDFNANLNFINDKPIPITTYFVNIEEENRLVPGILFLAIIENPESLTCENHEVINWISQEELENIKPDEGVPNFHETANKAFEVFKINTIKERSA